jgi:hypothetical protein
VRLAIGFVDQLRRRKLARFARALVQTEQGRTYRGSVRRTVLLDPWYVAFEKAQKAQAGTKPGIDCGHGEAQARRTNCNRVR